MVIIHKGNTDNWGIGLLDTLWEVVEALIETHLRTSLKFYDVLHRFRAVRGTGTTIMELKLAQDIASIDHNPLLLVFLDLSKACDTMDR